MRPYIPILATLFLACGPTAPPLGAGTTGDETTTAAPITTTTPPDPTTIAPTTTSAAGTTAALDPTASSGTTLAHEFVTPPDCGSTCPFQCDNFAQDCDPGQKCVPSWNDGAWDATKCVDVTGDGQPGDPCTAMGGGVSGIDDCAFGSFCWGIDAENHGTCVAQCTGTPDVPICPPPFQCAIFSEGALAFCFSGCDPLLQDCADTDLCIPDGDGFSCALDASGDEGQTNDPCELANGCDKGLVCLDPASASAACDQDSPGCCQPFCEFIEGQDGDCPNPDQKCLQWFDPMMPIPPGLENVGFCGIPT